MYDFIERRGGSTVFKWGYCAMAILLIIILVIYCTFARRYTFDGEQFALSHVSDDTVVMVDRNGHEAQLRGSSAMFFNGGTNTVTYMNRTIQCSVDWNQTGDYIYTFSDGSTKIQPLVTSGYGNDDPLAGMTPLQRKEYDLMDKLETYLREGDPIWPSIGLGLVALLVMLLGMAMLCFPEALWRRQTMFTVQGGEPTDWAIFSNRTAGLVLVVFSFVIPFLQV